jgi:Secretion system C-terminal sorting domain
MKDMKTLLIIVGFALCACVVNAQTFEIRATKDADNRTILIQLRSTGLLLPESSNSLQDLVFGVKWLKTCGRDLDLSTLTNSGYNVIYSTTVREENGIYYYRAFAADPTNFPFPSKWTVDGWVTIASLSTNNQATAGTCTFSICELGFDNALSNQTGPNLNIDFTDFTPALNGIANDVILPVTLLDFGVRAKDEGAHLVWKVESEINVRNYIIERATGQATKFIPIGFIKANKMNRYEFIDQSIKKGDLYYYRLKISDIDDRSEFSKIVSFQLDENLKVKIYPNPLEENVNIDLGNIEKATVTMYDVLGKVIFTKSNQSGILDIDLFDLISGVYLIEVEALGKTFREKVIKN